MLLDFSFSFDTINFGWFIVHIIAPDKAVYCVFTQFPVPENAIKFISVRTKTQ